MITKITIENFKSVRDRIELELRPITMLFGANSSGKSTILHALHYAREVFERHNLDADKTISGGNFVDLGGFNNFVHNRNLSEPVKLGFSLDLTEMRLPDFCPDDRYQRGEYTPASSLLGDVSSADVDVEIRWSNQHSAAYVSKYCVCYDDIWFASIESQPGRKGCSLKINTNHPRLTPENEAGDWPGLERYNEEDQSEEDQSEYRVSALLAVLIKAYPMLPQLNNSDGPGITTLPLAKQDALPDWLNGLSLPFKYPQSGSELAKHWEWIEWQEEWITESLSQMIVGPGKLIRDSLAKLKYLGPLRETPPRNYTTPRFLDESRWSSGLGAWDALQSGPDSLMDSVAQWLGDKDKLNSGYSVERRNLKEVDLSNPHIVKILSGQASDEAAIDVKLALDASPTVSRVIIVPDDSDLELRPHDVGIGISQVVPVVVTALDGRSRILAIEQPELHLHPKLQAELGDLFIEAALGDRKHLVILETHSEVIPLRLMRRIRETANGKSVADRPSILASDVAIYYVEAFESATVVTHLELSHEGQLLDPWPDGFFEEGFRERFTE